MLRKDREITDAAEIIAILNRCDTIRVGVQGIEYPYVVPVSFGLRVGENGISVYFHCARKGYKTELLQNNPKVCVEGDRFVKVEETDHGITTRYESVIAFGTAEMVTGDEKVDGLKAITEHYGFLDYPIERCRGLEMTSVYRIALTQMTGKHNQVQ